MSFSSSYAILLRDARKPNADAVRRAFSTFSHLTDADAVRLAASVQPGDYEISASLAIPVYQPEPMQSDFEVRYAFLNGEDADYSGMAGYYRNELESRGLLRKLQPDGDIPFYLELVGAVNKRASFLGVPYDTLQGLTTFDQAIGLLERLGRENLAGMLKRSNR